jgi:hypothetical protein
MSYFPSTAFPKCQVIYTVWNFDKKANKVTKVQINSSFKEGLSALGEKFSKSENSGAEFYSDFLVCSNSPLRTICQKIETFDAPLDAKEALSLIKTIRGLFPKCLPEK